MAVKNANKKQSINFGHFYVPKIFPLQPLILVLILIKNGPKSPLIIPIIMAPGITEDGVVKFLSATPNFSELSDQSIGFPCKSASKTPRVNVAVEVVMNTFHNSEKFQKGFSNESSYMNKAPPIGAPKAILTPALAPAAMSYRLF